MRAAKAIAVLFAILAISSIHAEDWPQWRGPGRDNKSAEKNLLKTWPEGGPKLLWTFSRGGNAYSSFAVVGDRLYTMGATSNGEYVYAIDVKTGKSPWATRVGRLFTNGWGDGPRSTPTVDGKVLYALTGNGDLACLQTDNGKEVWNINLRRALGGNMMSGWGYSESVLVDGDQLICTPGGRQGTLAALDKRTGKVIWRSKEVTDAAAYSSPIVAEVNGIRHYIQQTGSSLIGVQAKDGKLLWRHPNRRYRTAVIPTPIFKDQKVYVTVGYGVGCYLLSITPDGSGGLKTERAYANNVLESKHGGAVLVEGHLYGHHDQNKWVCQNFETGKEVWSASGKLDRRNRSGSLTYADGKLYLFSDQGTAALIEATPEGWKELGRLRIPQQSRIRSRRGGVWSHPVVANGRLYLRDQEYIFCYDVSQK